MEQVWHLCICFWEKEPKKIYQHGLALQTELTRWLLVQQQDLGTLQSLSELLGVPKYSRVKREKAKSEGVAMAQSHLKLCEGQRDTWVTDDVTH